MSEGHYAFSNGTQYTDWMDRNCIQCKKFDIDKVSEENCKIDFELCQAYCGSGTVPEEIAIRMGRKANPKAYTWDCPEKEAK